MALSLGRIIRHVARRRQRRPPHPGTPVENARDDSTPGRIPGQSSASSSEREFRRARENNDHRAYMSSPRVFYDRRTPR